VADAVSEKGLRTGVLSLLFDEFSHWALMHCIDAMHVTHQPSSATKESRQRHFQTATNTQTSLILSRGQKMKI